MRNVKEIEADLKPYMEEMRYAWTREHYQKILENISGLWVHKAKEIDDWVKNGANTYLTTSYGGLNAWVRMRPTYDRNGKSLGYTVDVDITYSSAHYPRYISPPNVNNMWYTSKDFKAANIAEGKKKALVVLEKKLLQVKKLVGQNLGKLEREYESDLAEGKFVA